MDINYTALIPEIILSVTGIILMLLIPFVPRESQPIVAPWFTTRSE